MSDLACPFGSGSYPSGEADKSSSSQGDFDPSRSPNPMAEGEPVDDEAWELAASECISAAQAAYDEALQDYDPTEPEHEVRLFDAMKEAIAAADRYRNAPAMSLEEIAKAWWDRVCPHSDRWRWEESKQRTDKLSKQLVAETYDDARAILALIAQSPCAYCHSTAKENAA